MKMQPNERAILAYFPSSNAAQETAQALQQMGIEETQIDRFSRYDANPNAEINNAITGDPNLTDLTAFGGDADTFYSNDRRVLIAADPSVSGIGNTDYGVAGGRSFLLTVVTDEQKADQARQVIKQKGGKI